MRTLFAAVLFSITISAAAIADENVAGHWRWTPGSGVIVNMDVGADGSWSSETLQHNKLVRKMRGTYKQTSSGSDTGTLVFTPTKSKVKTGTVHVETDKYQLAQDGKQLKLTSGGDTMVFKKHEQQ